MRPKCEKILPSENASWRYWFYEQDDIPFYWHYHQEYELCLILNSQGQRYIGDQIADYGNLDLVLLGPKLPHTWCSEELITPRKHISHVAQLPKSWIESLATLPDLIPLIDLLEKSKFGVEFSQQTAQKVLVYFEDIAKKADGLSRLINLIKILHLLVEDDEASLICGYNYTPLICLDNATEKIDKVIAYIHKYYTEDLHAEQMAGLIHMSTNHFHAFFKRQTKQTFTELINKLRIGKACSLLINNDLPIAMVAELCGFKNLSNFNRRFEQLKACTPRQFRQEYQRKSQEKNGK